MQLQKSLFSSAQKEALQDQLGSEQDLSVRKRIFSLDNTQFPGLDDLDKIDDSLLMKRKGKNNSGVKLNSNVSTTGSLNNFNVEEPLICDESKYTLSQFQKYMSEKDDELFVPSFQNETVILPLWKFKKPCFFEIKAKDHVSQTEQHDWEYLSNPEGKELSVLQKEFLEHFYPEYADKDPFSILDWLKQKALDHEQATQCELVNQFLVSLEESWGQDTQKNSGPSESNEDDEQDDKLYLQDEDYEEGEEDYTDEFQLPITKQDDLEYLKFNRVKTKSKSTHANPEESKQFREKLVQLKAKNEEKKKRDSLALTKKLSSTYKDIDLKSLGKNSSKSADRQGENRGQESLNHLTVLLVGPTQNGKSTLCGQILHQMGQLKKADVNKCIELPKIYKNSEQNLCAHEISREDTSSQWPQYLIDVLEQERKSGYSSELGRCCFTDHDNSFTLLDSPGQIGKMGEVIEGAAMADLAVLVVSAKKCEMKSCLIHQEYKVQIQDQLKICQGQGIKSLIVLVNKMEHMKWAQNKFDDIKNFFESVVEDLGFQKDNVQFIPASGLNCQNIVKPVASSVCPWYKGQSFIGALKEQISTRKPKQETQSSDDEQQLTMQIFNKFTEKTNLFVEVKVKQGSVKVGSKLTLLPSYVPAQALTITNSQGKLIDSAERDELVTIKLNIAVPDQVEIGQYLVCRDPKILPNISKELKIEFDLNDAERKLLITNGFQCLLFKGPQVFNAVFDEVQIKNAWKFYSPKYISSQSAKVACKVKLNEPMIFKKFDKILLRDLNSNITFGCGEITKFKPYDLGEISPLYKKRQQSEAKKIKEEYKNSKFRKHFVFSLKKVKDIQQVEKVSLQDAFSIFAKLQ